MSETALVRNPFPYQGTATFERAGTAGDSAASAPATTLSWVPVSATMALAERYLRRYDPRSAGIGVAISLQGDHGSGKTHTIRYLMSRMPALAQRDGKSAPFQLYVKAEGPSLLDAYRRLASQLSFEELRFLSLSFLGVTAAAQTKEKEKAVDALRRNPEKVYSLFDGYFVQQGKVADGLAAELRRLGGTSEYQHALAYLLSEDVTVAQTAYRWLIADYVGVDAFRELGVSGPIDDDKKAMLALHVVTLLLSRAGRPFFVFIDQYERLVLERNTVAAASNIGLLHTLVEVVPRENGMLVLSGTRDAWDALPPDLHERIGGNVVTHPLLSLQDAREILAVYLFAARAEEYRSPVSDAQLAPFDDEAVRAMLGFGGGNLRRLLQFANEAFERAFAGDPPRGDLRINARAIEVLLKEGNRPYFSEDIVTAEIVRILRGEGLRAEREYSIGGLMVDVAVFDEQGRARVLFEVRAAIFILDEVERALSVLRVAKARLSLQVLAEPVLVILGYASPEVSKALSEHCQEFIVYDPGTFAAKLRKLVGGLVKQPQFAARPDESAAVEGQLAQLQKKLEQLASDRVAQSASVDTRLLSVLGKQEARRLWAEKREQLEEDLRKKRMLRRESAFAVMERVHAKAERDRARQGIVSGVAFASMGLLGATVLLLLPYLMPPSLHYRTSVLARVSAIEAVGLVIVVIPAGIWRLLRALNLIGRTAERRLREPVASMDELREAVGQHPPGERWARDPDPHLRFAWALRRAETADVSSVQRALLLESSPPVRSVLAKGLAAHIGQSVGRVSVQHFVGRLIASAREAAAILVERCAQLGVELEPLPKELACLYAICRAHPTGSAVEVAPWTSERVFSVLFDESPESAWVRDLVQAHRRGLDDAPLPRIPEHQLRPALRVFSPDNDAGLCGLDDLQSTTLVESYFIFLQQIQFLMSRGDSESVEYPAHSKPLPSSASSGA